MEFKEDAKDLFEAMNLDMKTSVEFGDFLADTFEKIIDESPDDPESPESPLLKCMKLTYEKYKDKLDEFTVGFLIGSFVSIRLMELQKREALEMLISNGVVKFIPNNDKNTDPMYQ